MKPFYFFLLLVLQTTMGRGDNVQEKLEEEGGSVPLGERIGFDTELMMADLYIGDQWMASYQAGLDVVDQYKGRLMFYTKNGSFLLRDLKEGDSGNYTYSVHQAIKGIRNMTQIHIHVTVRGGGTPLCCTPCLRISGCMSLGCVGLSLLFYFLYDNGDLRMMVWVFLGIAVILTGINILPLLCGIPHKAGESVFPYGSLCSREGSCPIRLLGFLSLVLVLIFALCLFLAG